MPVVEAECAVVESPVLDLDRVGAGREPTKAAAENVQWRGGGQLGSLARAGRIERALPAAGGGALHATDEDPDLALARPGGRDESDLAVKRATMRPRCPEGIVTSVWTRVL